MANYNNIKATIDANIKTNNNQEITGSVLQSVLNQIVNVLGIGYQFAGIATPSSYPGNPDAKVFYIAATAGTYANFGGIVVNDGEFCVLCWNGSWIKITTGVATAEQVTALGHKVDGLALGQFYGFFPADTDLPAGGEPGYAYVGASSPFAIYVFKNGAWSDSGSVYSPAEGDGEDIDANSQGKLQFANRPTKYGMGYKILRRDATFAKQVGDSNTIYEIRYDFDLGADEVTIPAGCILKFVGGSLNNGQLQILNGVQIFNGNFFDCALTVRGDFRLQDSRVVITDAYSGSRSGCVTMEYGNDSDSCVIIRNNVLENRKTTGGVYTDCIKMIADNHNINFLIEGNKIYCETYACIESQGTSHYVSGVCVGNNIKMGGSSSYGLGISLVANNSNVVVADNIIESREIGIEIRDGAIITNNTITMISATASAIEDGLGANARQDSTIVISGNRIIKGRLKIINTIVETIIIGNEINGTFLLGRDEGYGRTIVSNNVIKYDAEDTYADRFEISGLSTTSRNEALVESNRIVSDNPLLLALTNGKIVFRGNDVEIIGDENTTRYALVVSNTKDMVVEANRIHFTKWENYYSQDYSFFNIIANNSLVSNGASYIIRDNIVTADNLATLSNIPIDPVVSHDSTISGLMEFVSEYGNTLIGINERRIGTTSQRPTPTRWRGEYHFFDTTLKKPLYWVRPNWYDAAGIQV